MYQPRATFSSPLCVWIPRGMGVGGGVTFYLGPEIASHSRLNVKRRSVNT